MKEDNNSLQGNVRDFVIKFFFIFIVTLILSVFVMWALSGFASSWSSFISSDKWVLTGESAAVWLTLAPLFAISLAGSYVAIRIAESANIAQQQGNALATQQTPEYIKAFESAFAYARLKGLLITLPMSTRSLNELPEDTVNDNPDAVLNNDTLDSLLNNFVDELYQTSLLSLLPSIAEKLANEDRKYHILMLFSSLNNRNNYFSTLQASLSLINVIDKLLDPKDLEKNDDLLSGLSKTEGFFLEHVAPYVTLNRNITYSDLDYYRNPIKKSFCKILNSQISQGDIDLKYTGKETCVVEYLEGSNDNSNSLVIVSPQDIVLYKVLEEVRTYAEDRKL